MTRRGASSPQPCGQAPVLSLGPAALHEVVPLPLVGQDSPSRVTSALRLRDPPGRPALPAAAAPCFVTPPPFS